MISALLSVSLVLGAAPGWSALDAGQRAVTLAKVEQVPRLRNRIVAVSGRFLGTPYVLSPLGEGSGFDPDPTLRYDAVDCLTFVEETLAMSLARSEAEVPTLLQQIRYAEEPSYAGRNHLMEAEWLPFNEAKGFIRDVTRELGGADAVHTQKIITRTSWLTPSSKALALPKDRQVTGRFPLWMLPLDKVEAHARRIPSGTILLVVRDDLDWKVTRITHLGFVIQRGGVTYLRHANKRPLYKVVDEPLDHFLARNALYEKWKVAGVALYEPQALAKSPVKTARAIR